MTDEPQTPKPTTAVTARVELDNLTRDETIAALDALPAAASLHVTRKHVVLGGKRFDVTAVHLSAHGAADFVAAVSDHMDAVANSVDSSQIADREGTELFVPAASLIQQAVQAYPGRIVISHAEAVELGLRPADPKPPTTAQIATEVEGWPFKPGDVVRDSGADADHAAWLDAAPDTIVLADRHGDHWKPAGSGMWRCTADERTSAAAQTSHELDTRYGPMTVVSL